MTVRLLREDDYENLVRWAKFFKFPYPAREFLPNNGKGGLMVEKDGIDICAGYIYFTNSKIAWLEFVVSNPEYRDKDRQEAIQIVINELTGIAINKGFGAIMTMVKKPILINHFLKCGFTQDEIKSTEMVYRV